jgi:hypothetical protein
MLSLWRVSNSFLPATSVQTTDAGTSSTILPRAPRRFNFSTPRGSLMKKTTSNTKTRESRINLAFVRLFLRILRTAVLVTATLAVVAQADDRKREKRENHNYIIERQQAYQVQGVPTSRLIIGRREIDVYPNGLMFEKNNVVGVRRGQ